MAFTGMAGSAGKKTGRPATWRSLCRRRVTFQLPLTGIGRVVRVLAGAGLLEPVDHAAAALPARGVEPLGVLGGIGRVELDVHVRLALGRRRGLVQGDAGAHRVAGVHRQRPGEQPDHQRGRRGRRPARLGLALGRRVAQASLRRTPPITPPARPASTPAMMPSGHERAGPRRRVPDVRPQPFRCKADGADAEPGDHAEPDGAVEAHPQRHRLDHEGLDDVEREVERPCGR